jgi:hypothetical protein
MLIEGGGDVMLQQLHDSAVNPSVWDICRNILDILAAEQRNWGL